MPRHALVAQAVRNTVEAERARKIYSALADITTGYRSLRHALSAAAHWDDELRDRVHDFVLESVNKGSPALASDVLRIALRLATEPGDHKEIVESLAPGHRRAEHAYRS